MTTIRAAGIILAKELRLEFRTRELLTATVIFALVVVVLFSFAFDPTAAESRRYGPGLLWIAFLFAGSLMLNPSFAREQSNDTLDALRAKAVAEPGKRVVQQRRNLPPRLGFRFAQSGLHICLLFAFLAA